MKEPALFKANKEVDIDYMALDRIIDQEFNNDKENLIMILQVIQQQYNYLPQASLMYLSQKIGVPFSQIYGLSTFYSTFSLEPRGRHIISVCLGTACYVRGGASVWERIQEILNVTSGETTEDMRFTLEPVRCVGCCGLGPVVKINEDIHSRISREKIQKMLDRYQ